DDLAEHVEREEEDGSAEREGAVRGMENEQRQDQERRQEKVEAGRRRRAGDEKPKLLEVAHRLARGAARLPRRGGLKNRDVEPPRDAVGHHHLDDAAQILESAVDGEPDQRREDERDQGRHAARAENAVVDLHVLERHDEHAERERCAQHRGEAEGRDQLACRSAKQLTSGSSRLHARPYQPLQRFRRRRGARARGRPRADDGTTLVRKILTRGESRRLQSKRNYRTLRAEIEQFGEISAASQMHLSSSPVNRSLSIFLEQSSYAPAAAGQRSGSRRGHQEKSSLANVLVISPSGEVYDHDCVRWYQHSDVQRSIR